MSKRLFEDCPELAEEHSALHEMACIIAEKWKGQLESRDCAYSYDGLRFQLEQFQDDMAALNTLIRAHEKNIEVYREEKRLKAEGDQ